MAKNAGSKAGGPPLDESSSGKGVVDLADARVRLGSRARPSQQNLLEDLDEVRSLLDQGLSAEAKSRLTLWITPNAHSIISDRTGSGAVLPKHISGSRWRKYRKVTMRRRWKIFSKLSS